MAGSQRRTVLTPALQDLAIGRTNNSVHCGMGLNGDTCTALLCGSSEGQSPAAGISEERRGSFPDEAVPELGLERWIGSGKCLPCHFPQGRGLGEERRAFPELMAGAKAQGHLRAGHSKRAAEELSVAGARGCFGEGERDKLFRENNQALGGLQGGVCPLFVWW